MSTPPPREALAEWMIRLAWRLRIWHDLPYCLATAHQDPNSPMTTTASPLLQRTTVLLTRARSTGGAAETVTATELPELITTLSWGVDRFNDDEPTARRRMRIATAGVFTG